MIKPIAQELIPHHPPPFCFHDLDTARNRVRKHSQFIPSQQSPTNSLILETTPSNTDRLRSIISISAFYRAARARLSSRRRPETPASLANGGRVPRGANREPASVDYRNGREGGSLVGSIVGKRRPGSKQKRAGRFSSPLSPGPARRKRSLCPGRLPRAIPGQFASFPDVGPWLRGTDSKRALAWLCCRLPCL